MYYKNAPAGLVQSMDLYRLAENAGVIRADNKVASLYTAKACYVLTPDPSIVAKEYPESGNTIFNEGQRMDATIAGVKAECLAKVTSDEYQKAARMPDLTRDFNLKTDAWIDLHAWVHKSKDAWSKAEKKAAEGSFDTAVATAAAIEKEDVQQSHRAMILKGKAKAGETPPEKPESPYFPSLLASAQAEHKALAAKLIEEAKQKIAAGDGKSVKALLHRLSAQKTQPEAAQAAKDLLATMNEKP